MSEIKLFQNKDGQWEKYEPYCTIDCPTEDDYNYIKNALELQGRMKWRDIKNELPKSKGSYLICYEVSETADFGREDGRAIGISYFDGKKFRLSSDHTVTHWMLLPLAPKEE